ncbi:uncharacterized protein LOC111132219 isoform X2 [Crassostrea virginica]
MKVFLAYLEETEVQTKFRALMKQLFSLPMLPYNPYPGFALRFSGLEERFLFNLNDGTLIYSLLNTEFVSSYLDEVVCVRDHHYVWGLREVLSAVSPTRLQKYSWLVTNLSSFLSGTTSLALIGPAVFEGVYYSEIHVPQFRLEMTFYESELSQGIQEFADAIITHLEDLDKSHKVIDVHVPHNEKVHFVDKWSFESIHEAQEEFRHAVSRAVLFGLYPTANCVFQLDQDGEKYTAGQIQYSVNFKHNSEHSQEQEDLKLPKVGTAMLSLYDGVYLERNHAENYISLFMPDQEEKSVQSQEIGPFSKEATEGVRNYLMKKIAECQKFAELSEIVYWSIVLYQMNRASYPSEIAEELLKLCNSSVGQLTALLDQCQSLVLLTKANHRVGKYDIEIRRQLEHFRETTKVMFNTDLIDRNHGMKCFGDFLLSKINTFLDSDFCSAEINESLSQLYYCIQGMLIQVSHHLSEQCHVLSSVILDDVGKHSNSQPEPVFTQRQRPDPNGLVKHNTVVTHGIEDENMNDLEHERMVVDVAANGGEYNQMIKTEGVLMQYAIDTHLDETWHNFLTTLLNKGHLPPNPYPSLISLLRQQAMRMDLLYQPKSDIVKSLFQISPVSEEKDAKPEDKQSDVYKVNGVDAHGLLSAVYILDNAGFVLISDAIQPLIQNRKAVKQKQFLINVGTALSGPSILYGKTQPYLRTIDLHDHYYFQGPAEQKDMAVQVFANMVETYVAELILKNTVPVVGVYLSSEHWSWEAIINRHEKEGFSEFSTVIYHHVLQKKPFYMKAVVLIEWRYVTVEKYFLLHYLTDKFIEPELFYPESGITIYQSVFFTKERAQYHRQNGQLEYVGGSQMQDLALAEDRVDQLIVIGARQTEWLEVYRGLLLKSLLQMMRDDTPVELKDTDGDELEVLSQEQKQIAEAWYVLHSMAAQMEYVIALTSTLQDLTQLFMELDRYKVKYDDYMAKVSIEERPPTPANVKKKKEKERKQKVKLTQKMREEEKAAKKNLFEKQKMVINEEKLSKEKTNGKAEKKTEEKTEEKAEEVEEEELWEEEFETKKTPTVFESRKEAGFVVIENFKMMVDEATFGRMVMIYWRKLMQVLSAKIFMVTPSLRSYIELRLSPCLEDDPQSGNFYLAYKTQTIERLEEIKNILQSVQGSLSCDVHMIFPETQPLLQELLMKYPN